MSHRVRFLLVLFLGFVFAAPAAANASANDRYPARLSVAGGLTITSQHGELKDCQPAQRYTLEERAEFEVAGKVIIERMGNRVFSSTGASKAGGAESNNVLTEYAESNYCPPDDDPIVLDQPNCNKFTGRASASLMVDYRLKRHLVAIGLSRDTGGSQKIDCMSLGVKNPTPLGTLITTFENTYADIALPLDLKIMQFKTLGVGKKFIRRIHIGGACDAAIVYHGSKISKFNAQENSCEVDGDFNVEIKRLKKKA